MALVALDPSESNSDQNTPSTSSYEDLVGGVSATAVKKALIPRSVFFLITNLASTGMLVSQDNKHGKPGIGVMVGGEDGDITYKTTISP